MNELLKEKVKRLGELYSVLMVGKQADAATVRASYRELVLKCHPDKNPTEESKQMFLRVNQAYTILKDPQLKEEYDRHLMAQAANQQRIDAMSHERKKFAADLNRREAEAAQQKADTQQNLQKRAKHRQEVQRQHDEREKMREELLTKMPPSDFYQSINSVRVTWAIDLQFNQKLLKLAFRKFGEIRQVVIEKQHEAVLQFSSIEAADRIVQEFKHPKIKVSFMVGDARRKQLLRALHHKKTADKIDLTLNSDNLKRLTEMINRNSNTYVSLQSKQRPTNYEDILRKQGFI